MTTDVDAPGDKQLEIIRGLRGVVHAFYLDRTILEQIKEEEAKVRAMGNIAVDNQGFTEALKRESVICIVKDPRFRPPPEPTVVLDAGDGQRLGEEVFPFTMHKYENRQDVVWLSDGFVLFPTVHADGGEQFTSHILQPRTHLRSHDQEVLRTEGRPQAGIRAGRIQQDQGVIHL